MKLSGNLALDRSNQRSLQTQLTGQLMRMIQSGDLLAGEHLPSTREMAQALRISRNTVVAAYEMLVGEGYLESQLRSGFQVGSAARAFQLLPVNPKAAKRRTKPAALPSAPLPFRPTQPDVNLLSMQIWNRHRARALKRESSLLHYQSRFPVGLDELRQNVAAYLRDSRAVRCEWQQVAITSGSQQALFLLAHLLLRPGQRVYVEDPGYAGARDAWNHAGAIVAPAPVDKEGLRLPERAAKGSLIYVTPSHQFPLGVCMSLARRLSLLRAARTWQAWIVEDDYDGEFRYESAPQPSLQSLDEERRVIYIGSFSKTLFPSLRIGYVVLPPELVEGFAVLKAIADNHGPLVDQATLAGFLESGAFYSHLRRCRKLYAERQGYFLQQAARQGLPLHFPITGRGLNLAGMLPDGANDRTWSLRLRDAALDVPPLSSYAVGPVRPGLLFGLSAFNRHAIQSGVTAIARVFEGAFKGSSAL
ncbi:MAG: PLP-dependent aminotransferase family protein [Terracidiphilus sp.]